jgi:hypothetical protein
MHLCVDNEGDYFKHLMKWKFVELVSVFLFCSIVSFFSYHCV